MIRNPKQEGTKLFDCIPQTGPCPNNCNQCYYNRCFYLPINEPHFPTLEEVGDGIVRVNSGHDSNIDRDLVIKMTNHYPKRFFNTSIPNLNFPAPVVFTANPREEIPARTPDDFPSDTDFGKLMFVRLRVSSTNLEHIVEALKEWRNIRIPCVLTFMRYYELGNQYSKYYVARKHILHESWNPTEYFMRMVSEIMLLISPDTLICGTFTSPFCRDCLNCQTHYERVMEYFNG